VAKTLQQFAVSFSAISVHCPLAYVAKRINKGHKKPAQNYRSV